MKNNKTFLLKSIILIFIAIIFAVCIFASFFITVDFSANKIDLLLYRTSVALIFIPLEIGILFETNIFGLRKKIPLVRCSKFSKHILFWVITVFIAILLFAIVYGKTSESFKNQLSISNKTNSSIGISLDETMTTNKPEKTKKHEEATQTAEKEETNTIHLNETITWKILSKNKNRYELVLTLLGENFSSKKYSESQYSKLNSQEKELVEKLYKYYSKNHSLPKDFKQTFTDFCVGDEYADMILETFNNPFYAALSKSFVISWSSNNTYYIEVKKDSNQNQTVDEDVREDNPLTFVFSDNKNIVGNCSIVLTKLEIVQKPFKTSSGMDSTYSNFIRIHATVKNNSSQETYFSAKKTGGVIIGQYYSSKEKVNINWNNNYKWKVDKDLKTDFGFTLGPKEIKNICISGVYINADKLKYSDEPRIDLYFSNNKETLTLPINK